MATKSIRAALLVTLFFSFSTISYADGASDEARRQAQMASARASAAAIDRRNADQAFQQGLARSTSSTPNAGSSPNARSSSTSGAATPSGARANNSAYSGAANEGFNPATGTGTVIIRGNVTAASIRSSIQNAGVTDFAQTAQRLGREAAAGNAQSQYLLGRMTYAGYGVTANEAEARRLFVAAANQRHIEASAYAGQFLVYGKGGPVDLARGMSYLENAAQAGNNDAKSMLGVRYMTTAFETGNNANMPRAIQYLEQSAQAGNAVAQATLGTTIYYYGVGGTQTNGVKAVRYMRMGAAQGETMSMYHLGNLMVNGDEWTGENRSEGWSLIARAAQAGEGRAMAKLGLAKLQGSLGQTQDSAEGTNLMRRSAEAGDRTGMHIYGNMLYNGENVAENKVAGIALVRRSADLDYGPAHVMMGKMSFFGDVGIPKDLNEAARRGRLAAATGAPEGQYFLGQLYYDGAGVPKDLKEALRWFRRAAAQGLPEAIKDVADPEMVAVARTMTD